MNIRTRDRDPLVEETLFFVKGMRAFNPTEPARNGQSPKISLTKKIDSEFLVSERAYFRRRVIRFRTEQQGIRAARERYYEVKWAQIRSALGT